MSLTMIEIFVHKKSECAENRSEPSTSRGQAGVNLKDGGILPTTVMVNKVSMLTTNLDMAVVNVNVIAMKSIAAVLCMKEEATWHHAIRVSVMHRRDRVFGVATS